MVLPEYDLGYGRVKNDVPVVRQEKHPSVYLLDVLYPVIAEIMASPVKHKLDELAHHIGLEVVDALYILEEVAQIRLSLVRKHHLADLLCLRKIRQFSQCLDRFFIGKRLYVYEFILVCHRLIIE